ncbi:hypothetical protein P7K49_028196 [Saguinus oedipus]|uniref:Uncharacterized protein n=1 Tax=Saguinus oedipus TaxID=9490 RepID=A0ABQ9UBK5_SAGOE|nr:hypothetical protein P7K49_028196 [Saguinus oedipus]
MQHIVCYLGCHRAGLAGWPCTSWGSLMAVHLLLPSLWVPPHLTQLLLNCNWLIQATACELTEAVKDTTTFSTPRVDLSNNGDLAFLAQPLLVYLLTSFPTIMRA